MMCAFSYYQGCSYYTPLILRNLDSTEKLNRLPLNQRRPTTAQLEKWKLNHPNHPTRPREKAFIFSNLSLKTGISQNRYYKLPYNFATTMFL